MLPARSMSSRLSPRCGMVMWTRVALSAFARELLAERVFEFGAVLEVHRNVDVARDVGLSEIELAEQGGENSPTSRRIDIGRFAGLPRRTRGDRGPFRRACGTGSRRASGSRSDSRRRRRRRLRRRRCAASPVTARRSRSGRDTWRRARTPRHSRLPPCARAGTSPGRFGGLRGRASRRARLRA